MFHLHFSLYVNLRRISLNGRNLFWKVTRSHLIHYPMI